MKRPHFKLKNTFEFTWHGLTGRTYSERTDFERVSAARVNVTGRHGLIRNKVSDIVYLILDGSGWFDLAGDRFDVEKDDVVIVPRRTDYDYGGKMELFLVHTPSYNPENDVDIESMQK